MARIFISHSSCNDDWAIALKMWLEREGWSDKNDIFLDLDPDRGISAGQKWVKALEEATTRCEVVVFLLSDAWIASRWCEDEYQLASKLDKKLFALLIDDIPYERLPNGLSAQWQIVRLKGDPAERFVATHPHTQQQWPVHLAEAGLRSLKEGLRKAGVGAETFGLQPDARESSGWRRPYRGLEALEAEDAAVFLGRNADILRGMDSLRRLAARPAPRALVILGASGAGKSSFLRAGLWPRLKRDDAQWLPLAPVRAGRGGAIDGDEGFLAALEEVYRRLGQPANLADLRKNLQTPQNFVDLLRRLRKDAARRVLLSEPPFPLPVLCLDQAEEIFVAEPTRDSEKFLALVRAAIDADAALLLASIRSDSYGFMQSAKKLAGVEQTPFSLGPVALGEIARIIREPAEILRQKAGPATPVFHPAVVERLQEDFGGEADALPLLAFVLQRLMREQAGAAVVGLDELEATGGLAAAIESAAEGALNDAGFGDDRGGRREVLRRLFIPRLARVDRESKAFQRRVARQSELPADLLPLARQLTEHRLLVAKVLASQEGAALEPATLEVAHEALLRRWPTLAELLAEDRDALLLLDGVLGAAIDWDKAGEAQKPDLLVHRGSRLADALALAGRGPDWAREILRARPYLDACQQRGQAERGEKEAALERERQRLAAMAAAQVRTALLQSRVRRTLCILAFVVALGLGAGFWQYKINLQRQAQLDFGRVNLLAELATSARLRGDFDSPLRFSALATRLGLQLGKERLEKSLAPSSLATDSWRLDWRLILKGHTAPVRCAAFSPNGKRVVTASEDETVHLWDAETGMGIAVLRRQLQQDCVESATFSPDGKRFITASASLLDDAARLWDAKTGQEIAVLRGHSNYVTSAAFSTDGKRVVTASVDGTARVWDAETGKEIAVLFAHQLGPVGHKFDGSLRSAALSPDGRRVIAVANRKTVRLWDVETGKEFAVLSGHEGAVVSAVFSPDGKRIVTASEDKTARLWDAETGTNIVVLRGHGQGVNLAAFSPDGERVVTASDDMTARLWDGKTGKDIAVLRGHEGYVIFAVFSPDGKWIVTASSDKTARLWDVSTGQELGIRRGHEGIVYSAAFSPDSKRVVTASEDRTARLWDVSTSQESLVLLGHEGSLYSAVFSPDSKRIVTASQDKTARLWDAETGQAIAGLRGHENVVFSAAFSPDGKRIVTASQDKTARLWDAETGQELIVLFGHEDAVISAAFSPDGKRVVTASWDATARLWDAGTGKEIAVLRGHEKMVNSAAFSPDGGRVVTASDDKTARLWDAETGKEIAVLRGHEAPVNSGVYSPDGKRVVTASWDATARLWDADSGKEIAVLRGHEKMVNSAAFSPDGGRVVTASDDKTARLWDAETAKEIAVFRGHKGLMLLEGAVRWAAFSPDGKRVVTASDDKTARLWDVESTKEIAVLRGHKVEVRSTAFSPDGKRVVSASDDNTARLWDVETLTAPPDKLLASVCARQLSNISQLTRGEMRLAGYPDQAPPIDVCAEEVD